MATVLPYHDPIVHRKYWYRPLVLNQGNTGTCEGNGWTHWLADGPVIHPDIPIGDVATGEKYARELYVEATGDTTLQEGAYSRQLVSVLLKRGLVGAYYRADTIDEIVTALKFKGPVGFGCDWYRSMDQPRFVSFPSKNAWLDVDEASGIRGGHFFILDGIDDAPAEDPPFVRMHNSWGPNWAWLGTARISLVDLGKLMVGDAWICEEVG